jgi:uncharacterized membrane protein YuzA (DUF378 family)
MVEKWVHLIAMALIVIGGLNWGLVGLFNFNLVTWILGRGVIARIVFVAVGVAAALVAGRRDTYLPFLGETVMPCSLLQERIPDHADTQVTVHSLTPGAKVLFWAAEPETAGLGRIQDWRKAYLEYSNAGVTTADADGRAILRIRKPQSYKVPVKGPLVAHVHWRVCGADGLLGPVQMTPVTA